MTGSAGQRRVPEAFVTGLELPLPSLKEQRRIAEVLDRADELRAKRRQALAHLDDLTQSIFLESIPHATPIMPLGEHLLFITSGSRGWAKFYSESGSRFIRSLDVRMNEIDGSNAVYVNAPNSAEARRTAVKAGDVLLTITGSQIGRVATVPPDLEGSYISQHIAILRPSLATIRPEFLSYFLSIRSGGQRQIASAQYGQTKPGLNFKQIREFEIPIPPLDIQEAFCQRAAKVAKIRAVQQKQLAELDALFASLQDRAFRGLL